MDGATTRATGSGGDLVGAVRRAVIWRSGSQLVSQLVQWTATFLVIRILSPADYGLFAMTGVVLVGLNMLNGYGLANGLVRQPTVTQRDIRQLFGMLIVLNTALAVAQIALAPLAAAYYRQPEVADLLRAQALLYFCTPFIALPQALLSRAMEFRHQAKANITASLAAAATALGGALAGWGVWTLVAAPVALFATRALVLTLAARWLVPPSFDFRGAGALARYGGVMAAGQFFWFVQSQTDVVVAGRGMSAHAVGVYTTALFLAQIFVSKAVPALNEIAFAAYARLHAADEDALPRGFVSAVRIVMSVALPFYLGLFAVAGPLVDAVLGTKWTEAAPVVRLLALAMPFVTLHVMLTPACDARGRPGVGVWTGAVGATLMGAAFLIGVRWGPIGLAAAWVAAYPIYLTISLSRALPVIGVRVGQVGPALGPSLAAAAAMAALVTIADQSLPPMPPSARLASLVAVGVVVYGGWLLAFSRPLVRELSRIALDR